MEFAFPPEPPGYTVVLTARWLLATWSVVGSGILIARMRRWKFIRPWEMAFWSTSAVLSLVVARDGQCRYPDWDNDQCLKPVLIAAISVSMAGVAVGFSKLYTDGHSERSRTGMVVCVSAYLTLGFLYSPVVLYTCGPFHRSQCRNNLKTIGLAMFTYEGYFNSFPATSSGDEPVSWRVNLLPYIDQKPLSQQYDDRVAWDHSPNDVLTRRQVHEFSCPANYNSPHDASGRWFTAYSMPTGPQTVGEHHVGTKLNTITDGSSNTFLVIEACGSQIVWTEPRDVNVASQPTGINLKGSNPGNSAGWLSSYHRGGTHAGFADGSVRFISTTIDPAVLKKLATIDGGEAITNDDLR